MLRGSATQGTKQVGPACILEQIHCKIVTEVIWNRRSGQTHEDKKCTVGRFCSNFRRPPPFAIRTIRSGVPRLIAQEREEEIRLVNGFLDRSLPHFSEGIFFWQPGSKASILEL